MMIVLKPSPRFIQVSYLDLIALSQGERGWLINALHPVPLPLGEGEHHRVIIFRHTWVRA